MVRLMEIFVTLNAALGIAAFLGARAVGRRSARRLMRQLHGDQDEITK